MLRRAREKDVPLIQSVLNKPENWDKLEAYSDEAVLAAINDETMTVFVWEEDGHWKGFCWLRWTSEGTKIEEFGVTDPGESVGSSFFSTVLKSVDLDDGQRPLWLAVAADNAAAIRFYERFGFVRATLREAVWNRRKGPIADALIMRHEP
ncbi:MAG: GNAT family N-acetyltransferase [Kiloniellales bacterium]|nr:GNAT family N-acetyltransferase [Kiloniellales bacterium]